MAIGSLFQDSPEIAQMRSARAIPASGHVDARVLAATTAERHACPAGAKYARLTGTTLFYAKPGDNAVDAAIPAADVTDGSASLIGPPLVPLEISLGSATHISVIAPAICVIALEFWT